MRSTPAVGASGLVYFGTGNGIFYALEAETGEQRWVARTGTVTGSPAVGLDGTVYIGASEGSSPRFYAWAGEDGTRKWGFAGEPNENEGFLGSAAFGSIGQIYVTSNRGRFYALDAATGRPSWQIRIDEGWPGVYSSPTVGADGTVYAASAGSGLFALEPETGERRWAYLPETHWDGGAAGRVGGFHASPALGSDGTVFIGSTDGTFYAFDAIDGAVMWRFAAGGTITSSAAVGPAETVYFGAHDWWIYAVDGDTGQLRWTFRTGGAVHATPTLTADGTLYVGSYDGNLYALDAANGSVRWTFATGGFVLGSAAVGEDGTVFVGSFDGNLYALEGTAPLADGPWPAFRGGTANTGSTETGGPPTILRPLPAAFEAAGAAVNLRVAVGGERPMTFQWHLDGRPIPGATEAALRIPRVQTTHAGEYRLTAHNAHGQAVAATTLQIGFRLVARSRGQGTVDVDPASDLHLPGTQVVLTAKGDAERPFLGWRGDAEGETNPLTVTLDGHRQIAAAFATDPGETLWEFDPGSDFNGLSGPPAIGPDGTLYLVGHGETGTALFAVHPATGWLLWRLDAEEDPWLPDHEKERFNGTPVVHPNGLLLLRTSRYVNGTDVTVIRAFDPATREERWRYHPNGFVRRHPAIGPDGTIYARLEHQLEALDPETGTVRWSHPIPRGEGGNDPVVGADGTVYLTGGYDLQRKPRPLVALDGRDGAIRWTAHLEERFFWSGPVIGPNGTLYFTGGGEDAAWFYTIEGAAGTERWRAPDGPRGYGRSLVVGTGGTLFAWTYRSEEIGERSEIRALSQEQGDMRWRYELRRFPGSARHLLLGADNTLYASSSEPRLLALDTRTGEMKWEKAWPEHPEGYFSGFTLARDGTLYAVSGWSDGKLHAIQATSGLAQGGWPKPFGDLGNTGRGESPPTIAEATLADGAFSAVVPTVLGRTFQLEHRPHPRQGAWTRVDTVRGDGARKTLTDPTPEGAHRFYRVRSEATSD